MDYSEHMVYIYQSQRAEGSAIYSLFARIICTIPVYIVILKMILLQCTVGMHEWNAMEVKSLRSASYRKT